MMVKSSKKSGLGQTLNKAHKRDARRRCVRKSARHSIPEPEELSVHSNLQSVTDQTNLTNFFEEAKLAGRKFMTERRNLEIITEKLEEKTNNFDQDCSDIIAIPKRPEWDASFTPEQLDAIEKKSFLEWRKAIADMQEQRDLVLTPFEKNIEVWRQLWRVIERSDIIVQILDCRNPLLYICDALIEYVKTFEGKQNFILLNKADYLSVNQRKLWAEYFESRGLKVNFFSALLEKGTSNTNDKDVSSLLETNLRIENETDTNVKIYNKFEILDYWKTISSQTKNAKCGSAGPNPSRPFTVGLVGYPNVGKSSTINALLSAKRVAVSSTPGKTKHFQTFLVDENMMLCDCPGLVFPNFISSRSEMVVNGILPIDQMKDYVSPVKIIVERIPKVYFQNIYGLAFEPNGDRYLNAEDLLNALGFMRGLMTARGLPDISRAARKICKDYINGKILYCEPPPHTDKETYHSYSRLAQIIKTMEERSKDPNVGLKITDRQRKLMV